MKTLFYPKLAWDGIRKNKRMVFPYILTCVCMISMFYILAFLSSPETTALLPRGGETAGVTMVLGVIVIAIFSVIFLYYTNSFLIRRRAAEFGLYNVLGMNKRNLVRIISLETLITFAISILSGLFVGIALSKLAELGLVKAIGGTVNYGFRVNKGAVMMTISVYAAIFAVIWLSSVIRVGRSSAVSLLGSEKAGEKAPKANWLLGILGAVILGGAYYIAVTIEDPISAIVWFFIAVILVIIATYLLMIAGSVLLCRILQKNKKYYYNPKHFVSVSSMVYRMKRNGAGLASIAIIATMVLVIISSTTCLYFGTRDTLYKTCPAEVNLTVRFYDSGLMNEENLDVFREAIEEFNVESNSETEDVYDISYVDSSGMLEGNRLDLGYSDDFLTLENMGKFREVCFVSAADYNRLTGENISLSDGEAVAFCKKNYDGDTLELIMGDRTQSFKLVNSGTEELFVNTNLGLVIPQIALVVPDVMDVVDALGEEEEDSNQLLLTWKYCMDVKESSLSDADYADKASVALINAPGFVPDDGRNYTVVPEARESASEDYYSINGSLLFIGIILSFVFGLAAVLIIYYKQISEGYEDCKRFEVMRKVGMTGREIKKNINSQLLVVFFIPLVFAGLHLVFAFPMIEKLISLIIDLYNTSLFAITTLITFAIFTVLYAMVYKVTSNVYYNIVSGAK